MERIIKVLPLVFTCLSLIYVLYRYERNQKIAKEYYIIEGMTFYLIVGTIISIILKYNTLIASTGGLLFGILLGSIIKKDRYY